MPAPYLNVPSYPDADPRDLLAERVQSAADALYVLAEPAASMSPEDVARANLMLERIALDAASLAWLVGAAMIPPSVVSAVREARL